MGPWLRVGTALRVPDSDRVVAQMLGHGALESQLCLSFFGGRCRRGTS